MSLDWADTAADWPKFLGRVGMIGALMAGLTIYGLKDRLAKPETPPSRSKRALTVQASASSEAITKAVVQAGERGDLDKVMAGDKTARQILEEVRRGQPSPELEKTLADAERRGELDKPYSDGVTFKQILNEAKTGSAGAAIGTALQGAQARGDLDSVKVQGKSLNEYTRQAQELSRQADEQGRRHDEDMARENGADPANEDVHAEVQRMIELLGVARDRDQDARLYAAQQLSGLRLAANAQSAVPSLEKALEDSDPAVRDAAQMALGRIRMCERNTLCQAKWRK